MDQTKLLELQQQMKQNQLDLGDFVNDLDSWTDEIKKKEQTLKEQKPDGKTDLPPVRNSLDKKRKTKKKKVKATESDTKPKTQKIRSYDYRSWDQFNVDKALEDIDGQKSSSASEYENDEEWERERKQKQAVMFKDQGNQCFKEGKYAEAIECYTQGISCDPENAVLPANRAMALIKQEKHGAAELDCTKAIHLDPTYVKAYYRRGTARAALRKYEEAKEDFLAVLTKDKNNKQAKAELGKVEKILNPPEILQSSLETGSDTITIAPVNKPPSQRSKKPLRRIQIEEIGIEEKEIKIPQSSETKKKLEAQEKATFDEQFLKKEMQSVASSKEDNLHNKISELTNQVTATSLQGTVVNTSSEDALKVDLSLLDTKKDSKKPLSSSNSPQTSPRIPPVPTTSTCLLRDFKTLKNRPADFYEYLKAIPHQQYAKLLSNALEIDYLMQILNTLQEFYVPRNEDVFSVLEGLSCVKRFDMTVMFMSKEQKKVVSDLLAYVCDQKQAPEGKVSALAKKYGV